MKARSINVAAMTMDDLRELRERVEAELNNRACTARFHDIGSYCTLDGTDGHRTHQAKGYASRPGDMRHSETIIKWRFAE